MLVRPSPLVPGARARVRDGRLTNPGAESAKEYCKLMACLLRPFRGARGGTCASFETKTTLGNGYLGSRIDEERSEMRYLV